MSDKKLVILVSLRDPDAQKIQSLKEFITKYCGYTEKYNAAIEEYIIRTMGEEIAIVLDGYDELPEKYGKMLNPHHFLLN